MTLILDHSAIWLISAIWTTAWSVIQIPTVIIFYFSISYLCYQGLDVHIIIVVKISHLFVKNIENFKNWMLHHSFRGVIFLSWQDFIAPALDLSFLASYKKGMKVYKFCLKVILFF